MWDQMWRKPWDKSAIWYRHGALSLINMRRTASPSNSLSTLPRDLSNVYWKFLGWVGVRRWSGRCWKHGHSSHKVSVLYNETTKIQSGVCVSVMRSVVGRTVGGSGFRKSKCSVDIWKAPSAACISACHRNRTSHSHAKQAQTLMIRAARSTQQHGTVPRNPSQTFRLSDCELLHVRAMYVSSEGVECGH